MKEGAFPWAGPTSGNGENTYVSMWLCTSMMHLTTPHGCASLVHTPPQPRYMPSKWLKGAAFHPPASLSATTPMPSRRLLRHLHSRSDLYQLLICVRGSTQHRDSLEGCSCGFGMGLYKSGFGFHPQNGFHPFTELESSTRVGNRKTTNFGILHTNILDQKPSLIELSVVICLRCWSATWCGS